MFYAVFISAFNWFNLIFMDSKNFIQLYFGDPEKWQSKQVLSDDELNDMLENFETILFVETVERIQEIKNEYLEKFDNDPVINRVLSTFINEYQIRTNKKSSLDSA